MVEKDNDTMRQDRYNNEWGSIPGQRVNTAGQRLVLRMLLASRS